MGVRDRVLYYRTMLNLTQAELAESAGVPRSVVGYIESKNADVKVSTAVKLRDALGLESLEYLIKPLTEQERKKMKRKMHRNHEIRNEIASEKQIEYRRRWMALKRLDI